MVQKRNGSFMGLDFEHWVGPLALCYDAAFAALFCGLVLALQASGAPFWYVYCGFAFWVLLNLSSALFYTLEALVVSDLLHAHKSLSGAAALVLWFFLYALTGLRPFGSTVQLLASALEASLYSALLGAYVAAGLYFIFEVMLDDQAAPVLTGLVTYPAVLQQAACDLQLALAELVETFFAVTNNGGVISGTLFAEGLYFTLMNYRQQLRQFYALFFDDLGIACSGNPVSVAFADDPIARTAALGFSLMTLLVPFSLFRDAKYLFASSLLWALNFVALGACGLSLFFLNDTGKLLTGLVLPGASYARVVTPHGWDVLCCLGVMAGCSFLLALPGRAGALLDYRKAAADARRLQGQRGLCADCAELCAPGETLVLTLLRFVLSEALLFTVAAFFFFLYTASLGSPVVGTPSIVALSNATQYPAFMALNQFEVIVYNSCTPSNFGQSCVEDMVKGVLNFVTQDTLNLLAAAVVAVFPNPEVAPDVYLRAFLASIIGDIQDVLVTLEDDAVDAVFLSMDALAQVDEAALTGVTALLARVLGQVLSPLQQFSFGVFAYVERVDDLPGYLSSFVPASVLGVSTQNLPVALFLAVLLFTFAGVLSPSLAASFQMAFVLFLVECCLGAFLLFVELEAFLATLNFRLVVQWDMQVVYYELAALVLVIVAMFMLLSLRKDTALLVDERFDEMVERFRADFRVQQDAVVAVIRASEPPARAQWDPLKTSLALDAPAREAPGLKARPVYPKESYATESFNQRKKI